MTMVESVCQGVVGGFCLGLAYRPSPLRILSSSFFGGFGVYNYLLIRCSFLTRKSGESLIQPKYASPAAAFFSGSATAFMFRPGLSLPQVLSITLVSTIIGGFLGIEEETTARPETNKVSHPL